MFDYFAMLGPRDAFNSRGVALDDICTIAQQDRANFHRFGNSDDLDMGDIFFTSPDRRALFASFCSAPLPYFANAGTRIRNGTRSFYVRVGVYGTNGRISAIRISEGAG